MKVYAVTFPTFVNEDNLQFSATVAKLSLKFIAHWYDELWHITIFCNNADKRSLVAYPRVVYFLGDSVYSALFNTQVDMIGYTDLSGITLEVAVID